MAGYDSYYRTEDLLDGKKETEKEEISTVSLAGPLAFWVGIIVIAALLQLVAIPFATGYGHTEFNSYFNTAAGYILYIPGIILLPLITSLWIGERVSYLDKKKSFIAYKGLINAIYSSIIYAIFIFIIYFVMITEKAGALSAFSYLMFAEYLVLIPLVINIVMIPIFAIISAARRYG